MKKLIIAAGTGFLGQVLVDHFKDSFDEIVILTRGKSDSSESEQAKQKKKLQKKIFLELLLRLYLV